MPTLRRLRFSTYSRINLAQSDKSPMQKLAYRARFGIPTSIIVLQYRESMLLNDTVLPIVEIRVERGKVYDDGGPGQQKSSTAKGSTRIKTFCTHPVSLSSLFPPLVLRSISAATTDVKCLLTNFEFQTHRLALVIFLPVRSNTSAKSATD